MATTLTRSKSMASTLGPGDIFELFTGPQVPDPVTFMIGHEWLDRGNLYPRQVTLIKLVFLRDDLFTDYDHMVINEWITSYAETGNNGVQTDVYRRIEMLKADGYRWFREILLVMGRRAGKGHVAALMFAYVIWNYLAKGDPQGHYGVDRDKQLALFVFAGKKDQAKANLFGDVYNVVTGAPCFGKYINKAVVESISIFAPYDYVRMRERADRGVEVGKDPATFIIQPKESTLMAGRGPASFAQGYDEMAHVEDVYGAATPALDQFGRDAFIVEPSSPWQKMGQFYENYQHALELDEETGDPTYPEMLMLQLTSWDIYKDWEIAHEIDLFPVGFQGDLDEYAGVELPRLTSLKGAIQAYDIPMQRLERANPETFAVERKSHFASVMDAYLTESKVLQIFQPWTERPERYGPPYLQQQESGLLIMTYKAHADPSKSNCNFGLAVAHTETDDTGTLHCVFDLLHHWEPQNFPDGIVDYDEIGDYMVEKIAQRFFPDEITFDQFNSVATIQKINKRLLAESGPKQVVAYEKTATKDLNWSRAEVFKTATNMGLVHAPYYELAENELKFLQDKGNKVVDHPTTGPVQTKDVADCMFEVVHYFLGKQIQLMLEEMGKQRIHGGLQGGTMGMQKTPQSYTPRPSDPFSGFGTSRRVAAGQGLNLSRGFRKR
jgi:hypothetical protein